jgi:hypothetical protein
LITLGSSAILGSTSAIRNERLVKLVMEEREKKARGEPLNKIEGKVDGDVEVVHGEDGYAMIRNVKKLEEKEREEKEKQKEEERQRLIKEGKLAYRG